jgi:HPt (histidine-containing phosphotransfer) domain-containing protein
MFMTPQKEPLYSIFHDDPIYQPLLTPFSVQAPTYISRLEDALKSKDQVALKNILHEIKGTYANYGFPVIAEVAHTLEKGTMTSSGIDIPLYADLKNKISRMAKTYQNNL